MTACCRQCAINRPASLDYWHPAIGAVIVVLLLIAGVVR